MRRSSRTADAGVSRPTALPIAGVLGRVGADSTSAIRCSAVGMCRSRAWRTAMPATRARALGVGDVDRQPVGVDLLEGERHGDQPAVELGDRRPASPRRAGSAPSSLAAHVVAAVVRQSPWITGTSSAASAATSQASSSPPADALAGFVPPAASTVTTRASAATQRLQERGLGAAQRRAEHGQRPGRRPPRSRRTARRRRRCCRELVGPVEEDAAMVGPAVADARVALERSPSSAASTGGSKPSPVSSTVSDRNRAAARGCPGRPRAR